MDNPYQAPSADLHTSDNTQAVQYVGFWVRTAAHIIDTVVLVVLIFFIRVLLTLIIGFGLSYENDPHLLFLIIPSLLISVLPVLFSLLFWFYKSSTPGKMLFRSKIVDARTGGKPSKLQFVGRYFSYFLSLLPLGLGFFWVAWDERKQGWHDKLSGTIVVKPTTDPAKQISFD